MKSMKIFEPAMCCSTGLCGVSLDPELLRISTVLNTLEQHGVPVQRYNLTGAPAEFMKNKAVAGFLQKFGPEKLPLILVEDCIVIAGRYPTNAEFTDWLELPADILGASCSEPEVSCCCGTSVAESCCAEDAESCCSADCCAEGIFPEGCCTGNAQDCCSDNCCSDQPAPEGCCRNGCC